MSFASDTDSEIFLLEPRHRHYLEQGSGRIYAYQPNREVPFSWLPIGLLACFSSLIIIFLPELLSAFNVDLPASQAFLIRLAGIWEIPVLLYFFVYRALVWQNRFRRLAREGQLLRGEVISSQLVTTTPRSERPKLRVSYTFTTSLQQHTETVTTLNLSNRQPPPPGTPLAVLYVDEKLFKPL